MGHKLQSKILDVGSEVQGVIVSDVYHFTPSGYLLLNNLYKPEGLECE